MLFTWDTNNLCIIFRWWHVRGPVSLVVSLLGIVALTAAYEALRALSRRYELSHAKRLEETPSEYFRPRVRGFEGSLAETMRLEYR